ncbi:hypothetical protein [Lysobacter sp. CA199]|uniref:hypothetical protein n=1 Tax=Lysobacter sp. CA199 TaxID=3455608 RepID=UPI003F8D86F4
MTTIANPFLLAGAALSAMAALAHLGCIVFGASWYRAMGAGEQMARLAAAGHWYPTVVTLVVAALLSTWSLYALSGAGAIGRLPLLRLALCLITGVYLLRAFAFVALKPYFPGNSDTFWWLSSAICLLLGLVHLIGLRQVWGRL